jgi:hypothetical protein
MDVMIPISKNGNTKIGIERIAATTRAADRFLRRNARIIPTESRASAPKKYGQRPMRTLPLAGFSFTERQAGRTYQ